MIALRWRRSPRGRRRPIQSDPRPVTGHRRVRLAQFRRRVWSGAFYGEKESTTRLRHPQSVASGAVAVLFHGGRCVPSIVVDDSGLRGALARSVVRPTSCYDGDSPDRSSVKRRPRTSRATRGRGSCDVPRPCSFNNELGHPYTVLPADTILPAFWYSIWARAAAATCPTSGLCAALSVPCSTSARRTSGESRPSSHRRSEWRAVRSRCRPTGWSVLTAGDPTGTGDCAGRRHRWSTRRFLRTPPYEARGCHRGRGRADGVHAGVAGGSRGLTVARCRDASVLNTLFRRCRRARRRVLVRRGGERAGLSALVSKRDLWTFRACDGSRSSTTRTTQTHPRCPAACTLADLGPWPSPDRGARVHAYLVDYQTAGHRDVG